MWEPEKEFEIMEEAEQYDFEDGISEELTCLELGPFDNEDEDENEDNDILDFEGDLYDDEEEVYWRYLLLFKITYTIIL